MTIGLTHTGNPVKHQFYIEWLKANEAIEIIKLSADDDNLEALNKCDALVLSGGIDVHPKYYGSSKTDYPGAPPQFNEERDQFEIAAFHKAQERKLPVLGICRGMQLINVIHNGTMIQHLDEDPLDKEHEGNPDKTHLVTIEEETMLHAIVGEEEIPVNSAHHQVIDKLGAGLEINALSHDGLVEGIERSDKNNKPFLLGVQWHPERMFRFNLENSGASKGIREQFISAIKNQMAKNEDH